MPTARRAKAPAHDVEAAVAALRRRATPATKRALRRYGIPDTHALGVAMRDVQAVAKALGRSHDLALALWTTGWYEARLLAAYVDEPAKVTRAQMARWSRDFDSWAVCDTLCFVLFDKTPHAWATVAAWAGHRSEFVKRAAFALVWGLTVHDKASGDRPFLDALAPIDAAAHDDRVHVKKAVSMALRAIGKRNAALHAAAMQTAERLAASAAASARWIGRQTLRELGRRAPRAKEL